jgi:pimeloyl-ACP methyl ester carboxylesterase
MGFSDATADHRDADGIAADLHALVRRAGIATPFVLVGHSIAGLYTRAYTDRYPGDVAGLVLVDPSSPFQNRAFVAVAPAVATFALASLRCLREQAQGTLVAGTLAGKRCGLPTAAELHAQCQRDGAARCAIDTFADRHQASRPYARTLLAETQNFYDGTSSAEVVREQRGYGALPLIVLTAVNQDWRQLPGVTAAQARRLSTVWARMHDRIAALSTRGVNFLVAPSGHYIQHQHPGSVISAVDEVVDQVRYR